MICGMRVIQGSFGKIKSFIRTDLQLRAHPTLTAFFARFLPAQVQSTCGYPGCHVSGSMGAKGITIGRNPSTAVCSC